MTRDEAVGEFEQVIDYIRHRGLHKNADLMDVALAVLTAPPTITPAATPACDAKAEAKERARAALGKAREILDPALTAWGEMPQGDGASDEAGGAWVVHYAGASEWAVSPAVVSGSDWPGAKFTGPNAEARAREYAAFLNTGETPIRRPCRFTERAVEGIKRAMGEYLAAMPVETVMGADFDTD